MRLAQWLDELQAGKRYSFTRDEALRQLSLPDAALTLALNRLKHKRRLVTPRRGFYVIVPVEQRSLASPPPQWFIQDLMRYMGQHYYLGLLTAATEHTSDQPHGVSIQGMSITPREYFILTDRSCRPSNSGSYGLQFIQKAGIADTPVQRRISGCGTPYFISSPEATALDLVQFASRCGGEDHITPALAALAPQLDRARLIAVGNATAPATVLSRLLARLRPLG